MAHAFNPSTWKAEEADFWVRDQTGLQSEFQDSQVYSEKPCLEKPKKKKRGGVFTTSVAKAGPKLTI